MPAGESALAPRRFALAADLPCDPPGPLGSTLAYALASMRNYVQMSIFQGATEDRESPSDSGRPRDLVDVRRVNGLIVLD
jgi:hypothetical protein